MLIQVNIRLGQKSDLCDFDHGMVPHARQAALSILESPDLLGFSHTTAQRLHLPASGGSAG